MTGWQGAEGEWLLFSTMEIRVMMSCQMETQDEEDDDDDEDDDASQTPPTGK